MEERAPYLIDIPHSRPLWVELVRLGRLWAKYCPATRQLECARGAVRVVFDLAELDKQHEEISQPVARTK